MSIKTLKLTERKGKYFRLERKSSGISDLHSSSALQIAGNHPLVNYEIFFKEEIKEKNTRLLHKRTELHEIFTKQYLRGV